jgi:tellurite resistance protein TerC
MLLIEWGLLGLFLYVGWLGEASVFSASDATSLRTQIIVCIYWVILALVFNVGVLVIGSGETAEIWMSGYVLEYTLSIDNLFVFQAIFKSFETPESLIGKALNYGIGAAAVFRLFFFVIGTSLFEWVGWIRIPFGLILMFTAYRTYVASKDTSHSSFSSADNWMSRAESYLPFVARYDTHGKFFQFEDSPDLVPPPPTFIQRNRLVMTKLLAVVVVLAFVDVLFALDAVAAKVTQSPDLFINFSSSILAMASFRSLYFVIAELALRFTLLTLGISVILVYVGFELVISNWVVVPNHINCGIILGICGLSMMGSLFVTWWKGFGFEAKASPPPVEGVEIPQVFGLREDDDLISPSRRGRV